MAFRVAVVAVTPFAPVVGPLQAARSRITPEPRLAINARGLRISGKAIRLGRMRQPRHSVGVMRGFRIVVASLGAAAPSGTPAVTAAESCENRKSIMQRQASPNGGAIASRPKIACVERPGAGVRDSPAVGGAYGPDSYRLTTSTKISR